MTRLRRSAHYPLILLAVVLIVFCGTHNFRPGIDRGTWDHPESEDPLDIEVPLSERDRFVSISEDGRETTGRDFPNEAIEAVKFLDGVRGSAVSSFKNSEVVFVTYSSSNHFLESREAIRALRQVSNQTLFYYDLGLDPDQVKDLEQVCNVKVVPFKFDQYPPHAKQLLTYAFKPILMGEMYKNHKAFWVIDASARFFSLKELAKFYDRVRTGEVEPFSAEHPAGHTLLAATNEGMFDYLPLPMKGGRDSGMRQALTMFVVRSRLAREVVKWNMVCALTQQCIAPEGTTPFCSVHSLLKRKECHRFDQSSVNTIICALQLRRKLPCLPATAVDGAYSSLVTVSRDSGYSGPLPTC